MKDVDPNEKVVRTKSIKTEKEFGNDISEDDVDIIKNSLDAMNKQKPSSIQNGMNSEVSQNMINENFSNDGNYFPINDIPSKYRLYPVGTKILGRPLKVMEVKKLSSINGDNADFIINDILQRSIKGINIKDILIPDKIYLVLWLRANTYRDSGYVVDFKCTKCEKKSNFHFGIDDLEVKHLSDEYNPNNQITLQSGDKITFKFLTVGDEITLDRFMEMNTSNSLVSEFDTDLLRIASMITSINSENVGLMQKYNYILDITPGDLSYINSYIEKYGMGIEPYINVQCKKCGGTSPVGISFHSDFFVPSYNFD